MNNWCFDALKYANRLATNSGGWKEGEQEEVEKVLSFIGDIHDTSAYDSEEDSLYNVFENGYCYYFANILNLAFPNIGRVVWVRPCGHIVWQSLATEICYDISGIYLDYETTDNLIPVDRMGQLLKDFKHNGEEYRCYNPDFKTWCDKYGFNHLFSVTAIYKNLPELSGKIYKAWDELYYYIEDAAIKFWEDSKTNKKACFRVIEAELRKGKF